MDEMSCAHLRISGRVQGVWYRASAKSAAQRHGLVGWVKNEADGSVTALAQGPRPQIEAFVKWCRQGPPAARVEDVEVEWRPPSSPLPSSFEIKR